MANKIFQDPTSQVPRSDPQFIRVPFDGTAIAGRADFIPKTQMTEGNVSHVSQGGGKK